MVVADNIWYESNLIEVCVPDTMVTRHISSPVSMCQLCKSLRNRVTNMRRSSTCYTT